MLTKEEQREIENALKHVPKKSAASIEALRIVQQHRGWVSDESIEDVANFLEMSADEVDNVATFYNLIFRKQVGRHVILICDSVSCYIMGYQSILEQLKQKLNINYGETTADNRFTLLPIPCLGTCDHAPAMIIDDDLHKDLAGEKLDEILANYE